MLLLDYRFDRFDRFVASPLRYRLTIASLPPVVLLETSDCVYYFFFTGKSLLSFF
jgi:hypothetical protein